MFDQLSVNLLTVECFFLLFIGFFIQLTSLCSFSAHEYQVYEIE